MAAIITELIEPDNNDACVWPLTHLELAQRLDPNDPRVTQAQESLERAKRTTG